MRTELAVTGFEVECLARPNGDPALPSPGEGKLFVYKGERKVYEFRILPAEKSTTITLIVPMAVQEVHIRASSWLKITPKLGVVRIN